MTRKKEFKDNWRYNLIGDNDWIIDNFYSYNPEDDIIEALDKKDADQVSEALTQDDQSNEIDLHSMLEKLPERYQSILWDYYFEGLSLPEIGKKRGYSKQYAHQEFHKAIDLMKDLGNDFTK